MPNKYAALVIGPVYKTILQARSTRELWAASYFFSAFMREILLAANKANIGTLLSPALIAETEHIHGAGIYPDRAFWKIKKEDAADQFPDIINRSITSLQKKLGIPAQIIRDYIQFSVVQLDETTGEDIILQLNKLLDTAELYEKTSSHNIDLPEELENNIQLLYDDGHQNWRTGPHIFLNYQCNSFSFKRLPSIIELSTRDLENASKPNTYKELVTTPISEKICELITKNRKRYQRVKAEEEQETLLMEEIKKQYGDDFKLRHKYIAFVYADGDNMGTCLKAIGNDEEKLKNFSEALSRFSVNAAEIIVNYGGIPVFIGGDDLLFALPLVNSGENAGAAGRNLYSLIQKLDAVFPVEKLRELSGNKKVETSISYGISIGYYKYPMADMIEMAHQKLYEIKKSKLKNRLGFEVRKHSGQLFGTILPKGPCLDFFITDFFEKNRDFNDAGFLASTIHKFKQVRILYMDAMQNNCLDAFYTNHLNEKIHHRIRSQEDNFLESVRNFSALLYTTYNNAEAAFESLYACLRVFQFLNQPDHV
ncbi:MAG: type III-B CRISPR-associated protein Cas10/Cmr2 [Ferruginibacter sp.]